MLDEHAIIDAGNDNDQFNRIASEKRSLHFHVAS